MIYLYAGLVLFFGPHFYSAFRSRAPGSDIRQRLGDLPFMGLYSVVSLAGFVLIIYGYRSTPAGEVLYALPFDARHILALVNLFAFILLVAAYVPGNMIKKAVRHPMLVAIILWAASHLLMPTDLKELLLFGSFLAYGVIDAMKAYTRPEGAPMPISMPATVVVLVVGIAAYAGFLLWGHAALIGVAPL